MITALLISVFVVLRRMLKRPIWMRWREAVSLPDMVTALHRNACHRAAD